jgi:hypothetical protein
MIPGNISSSIIKDAYNLIGSFTADGSNGYPLIFSGIPQTYKDLVLVINSRSTIAGVVGSPYLRLNDSDAAVYQSIFFEYNQSSTGPAAGSASRDGSNATLGRIGRHPGGGSTAGTYGSIIVNINNYASTSMFKTVLSEYANSIGASGSSSGFTTFIYRNTAAITSIRFSDEQGGNIAAGSTFKLYGIKAVN